MKKDLGQMLFNAEGGAINWFPGHMVAATKAIRARLKLADLVIEVRDSRIPVSSANIDLQSQLGGKRRVIALNKSDLANTRVTPKWVNYFNSLDQHCISINAYNRVSVQKLLMLVEMKLKELITREPTLLVMVVGVPNVGKSALINSIHQIAASRFPVQDKKKRAVVGPLPGVTQDIAGYKIAHRPSIYVLDTPGVLVPSIPDIETGLKLALTGSVKNSVVGEERIAQYLLAVLNTRSTPFRWSMEEESNDRSSDNVTKRLRDMKPGKGKTASASNVVYVNDVVTDVKCALFETLAEFEGDINDENDLENLIEKQFDVLQKVLKVPYKAYEGRLMVAKKFLLLFRTGKLGQLTLDQLPGY